LKVERSEKFGGNVGYKGYKELERDFVKKKLHPMDLKQSVAKEINGVLEPIRKRFEKEKKLMREAYP
jgi:tyrosyl-tRNA synthetase